MSQRVPLRVLLVVVAIAAAGPAGPLDLEPARAACAGAYCDPLSPAPLGCRSATADHAERLFAAILRADHGGYDEAAEIGALIAQTLTATPNPPGTSP